MGVTSDEPPAVDCGNESTTAHVAGPRPTPRQLAGQLRDVAVAIPLGLAAPALRRWHGRWGRDRR